MTPELFVSLLIPRRLDVADGRLLLSLMADRLPAVLPERYGNWEPLAHAAEPWDLEKVLQHWGDPFLWSRGKPRVEGSVFMAGPRVHSVVSFCTFETGDLPSNDVAAFVQLAAESLGADVGFIHLLTDTEILRVRGRDVAILADPRRGRYVLSVTTHQLREGLPDLFWGTVFGPPYVRLFGMSKLLGVPRARVNKLGPERLYLQLSDGYVDILTDPEGVEAVRSQVRLYLGETAFHSNAVTGSPRAEVPRFDLPRDPSARQTAPPARITSEE